APLHVLNRNVLHGLDVGVGHVRPLPGAELSGRWPSPVPRWSSLKTCKREARKVLSGCSAAVAPTYIPGVISENLMGSSPRITVLSLSFTAAGPLLVSTNSSCPFSDVTLPFKLTLLCACTALLARKTAIPIMAAVQPLESLSLVMQRLRIAASFDCLT